MKASSFIWTGALLLLGAATLHLWLGQVALRAQLEGARPQPVLTPPHPPTDAAARIVALEARVTQLERQLRETRALGARMPLTAPTRARAAASEPPTEASSAPADESAGAYAEVVTALEKGDPQTRAALQRLVGEEIEARRDQRFAARRARVLEVYQAGLDKLDAEHRIHPDDVASLQTALTDETDQVHRLFREARKDFSFRQARQKAWEIRDQTDARARELLDEAQYEGWQRFREEAAQDGPRWMRRRPRDRAAKSEEGR